MRFTKETLRALDVCHDYVQRFAELFPTSNEEYRHGVEVTGAVCESVADKFDWYWAKEQLLNREANRLWNDAVEGSGATAIRTEVDAANNVAREQYNAARLAWRARTGAQRPGGMTSNSDNDEWYEIDREFNQAVNTAEGLWNKARARVFGELFENATNRHPRVQRAVDSAIARADQEAVAAVVTAEAQVADMKRQIERLTTELPKAEEHLVKVRAESYDRRIAIAERTRLTAEQALVDAKAAEEKVRAEAADAKAALDAQAALAEADAQTSATDATDTSVANSERTTTA